MSGTHFTIHAAVYLLLVKDSKVLLLRRFNTGWSDGMYTLVAGHLDGDEPLTAAMCREAREEAGITVKPEDLVFAHVLHRSASDRDYLDFFFTARLWGGEPHNTEPAKCDNMQWFPLDALPENILPYVKQVITTTKKGTHFSETGW
jgi:8-oxo-dGTP pyrophosphatase MutT (NUDIX family)